MIPQGFLQRLRQQLGPEYQAFLDSLELPRAVALRRNPLKILPNQELPHLLGEVPWESQGSYYDPIARPGLHPWHEAGVYYLQEASAMAPVALLDPLPGELVLDLCAAPGGKTTQIAGRMMGKGLLVCNEINPKRAKILARNIERMAVANALVLNHHPQELEKHFAGCFDAILVDAPCSGEGMFRKEEAAVTDWSEQTVAMCAQRQGEILTTAAKLLRPGGRLVYSTCTFAPQENEGVISLFLRSHPDFSLEDAHAPWFSPGSDALVENPVPGLEKTYRLWPHKLRGEGHFCALLGKSGDGESTLTPCVGGKLPKLWQDFAKDLDISLPRGKLLCFGQRLFWVPLEMPALDGLRVLRCGLELGEGKKDRFEPAHALALWLKSASREVVLEGRELEAYMNGQVLACSQKGWCLVKAGPYSIGWGKADGRQLKNHYPKGLRR